MVPNIFNLWPPLSCVVASSEFYFVEQESDFLLFLPRNHLKTHDGNHWINLSNILLFVLSFKQNKQLIKNTNGSPPVCYKSNCLKVATCLFNSIFVCCWFKYLLYYFLLYCTVYFIYFCYFCFSLCNSLWDHRGIKVQRSEPNLQQ